MRLVIAEKQPLAREIANFLGVVKKADRYVECKNDVLVSWCRGHLLKQLGPEAYVTGERVGVKDLPVIPANWKLAPKDSDAAKQLEVIKGLLANASEVVNAGDADREGQLLVDQVLINLGWRGKTLRLWLSSLDDKSFRKAYSCLLPNSKYQDIFNAALGRQRADWLVGFNASIAYSRNLQSHGIAGSWSIGRVQTPTLALLVDRKRNIEQFSSRHHYTVEAYLLSPTGKEFKALWKIPEDLLTDKFLLERQPAQDVVNNIKDRSATVESYSKKQNELEAPLPYNLSKLTQIANRRFGLSAKKVLDAAQELYEAKVSTYPRTDCTYLPEEQHGDAADVLTRIGAFNIDGVDPARKHSAWNTKKMEGESHHAIIPTGQPFPNSGSNDARIVYSLIRESYIRLFLPNQSYETRDVLVIFPTGDRFKAHSRITLSPGWTSIGSMDREEGDDSEESNANLPDLAPGDRVECRTAQVLAMKTKPPRPYTDDTLVGAMMGVHKLVADPKMKARLRESSGLGTQATRAGIIETLVSRGYALREKKQIHPTEKGCNLIDALRKVSPELPDPVETAVQEDFLADIAAGKASIKEFLAKAQEHSKHVVERLINGNLCESVTPMNNCPDCNGPKCAQLTSRNGWTYHKCGACEHLFYDENGKPGKRWEPKPKQDGADRAPRGYGLNTSDGKSAGGKKVAKAATSSAAASGPQCPACGEQTSRMETRNHHPYWRCRKCGNAWWPDREVPKNLGVPWPPPRTNGNQK